MLRLLGAIEAGDGESPPTSVTTPRLRLVLAVLGAHADRRVTVDRLMDILWPDEAPPTASTALQGYISKIRRTFEPGLEARGESRYLRTDAGAYVLSLPSERFDVTHFSDLARRGIASDSEALLDEALSLWRGEPFADLADEPWALGHATELRQLRLRAAQRRYALAITAGRDSEIIDALRADLDNNPFEERLAGLLMTALYRLGDQRSALDVFATTRERLLDELGLDPTPDLRNLESLILHHDASLLEGMQIRPPINASSNGSRTAMYGRSGDLDRLQSALTAHRLVTVTGTGGVGKTRLALELVDLGNRAVFVDLSPSSTTDDALGRLLSALDADGDPLTQPVTSIALAADSTCDLLVLDNCEHLLPDFAAIISALLAAPGSFRIVATSRQSIGLSVEHAIRLEPLPVADAGMTTDELTSLPSMRILLERSGLQLDDSSRDDLVTLLDDLDGLPLALELTAFRLRTIGLTDLDPHAADSDAPAPSDLPERHRSLDHVLTTSLAELDQRQRVVLESIAVFAGPVPLEAIVRLLSDDIDAVDVRIVVAELVDRSLVTMTSAPSGVKYGLLETVRTRCRRALDADGRIESLRTRRARLVRKAAQASLGPQPPLLGLDDLDADVDAVLGHLEQTGDDAQRHFSTLTPIATHWYGIGRVSDARIRLRTALTMYPDADPLLVGTASALLGMISFGEGAFHDLARYTEAALEILEPFGFPGLDFIRAGRHVGRGELADAQAAIRTHLDDPATVGRQRLAGLEVAATSTWFMGDLAGAAELFRAQGELARQENDHYFQGHALRGEAMTMAIHGSPEVGLELCRRADELPPGRPGQRLLIEKSAASSVIRDAIGDAQTAGDDAWLTLSRCVKNFDAPAAALTVPIAAADAFARGDIDTVARLTGWFDALCRTTGLYAAPSSAERVVDVVERARASADEATWIARRADGAALGLGGIVAARSDRSDG